MEPFHTPEIVSLLDELKDGDRQMDKDRIEGAFEQAKGAVKEGAGKLTGDAKLEAEGKAQKVAGKVQNTVGGMKDAVRDAADGKDK